MLTTYILLGRYLGCLLVGGATLRTFIYFLYAKFNKKPHIILVIFFEIYFVVISLFLWKDYSDLFMLANLCLLTYTTWQNNMTTFRVGYIFSCIFLITYDIFVGAYVSIISEVIMLVSSVYTLIKYSYLNKIKDIVLHFYTTLSPTYDITINQKHDTYYVTSPIIKDKFNNFCYLKNPMDVDECLEDVRTSLTQSNRTPAVYFQSVNKENINFIVNQTKNHKLLYHDCWMKWRTGYKTAKIKCMLEDVIFRPATEEDAEDLLYVFDAGFISCSDNEVYKYPHEYLDQYKKILEEKSLKEKNICPYIAYYKNEPISVLFLYVKGAKLIFVRLQRLKNIEGEGWPQI